MAKEDRFTDDGQVSEILPNGRFLISLEKVVVSPLMPPASRSNVIRVIVGDPAVAEVSPNEMEMGRLVYRDRVMNTGFNLHEGKCR